MENILTPQNIIQTLGINYIPDNKIIYVRIGYPHQTYEGDHWRRNRVGSVVKIIVRDMRNYNSSWLVCGTIQGESEIRTFSYPHDTFMLKHFNKYFWILVAATKFKILLRRIRIKKDKKNSKTFLLWARTPRGTFGGMSNFPIRKNIIDFIVTY